MSNYRAIRAHVDEIALKAGRDPATVTLITVSKGHSWAEAAQAYAQGCRHFAENRPQEALEKIALAPQDIQWHFIGTLQKNKVNKVDGRFALIHSVDSPELAEKIHATPLLLQVNISGEASKHGLTKEEWRRHYDTLPHTRIEGLMTMAPLTNDETIIRACFKGLREFRDELESRGHKLPHLSMGMSQDYPIAIEEGATLLRVGSKIFR